MATIEDAAEQRKRAQVRERENEAKERLYRRLVREIATLERAGEHDGAAEVRKQRDQLQPEIDQLAAAAAAAEENEKASAWPPVWKRGCHFNWSPRCDIRQHKQLSKIGSKLADAVLAEKWKYAQRLAVKYKEESGADV